MINRQPLNLTASDLTETKVGGYHARWPRDPETTRRLDAVRNYDLNLPTQKPFPWIALLLTGIPVIVFLIWMVK